MIKHDLQPWDVKYHSGDIRYVVMRDGVATKERMVIVVVGDAKRLTEEMKVDLVKSISPNPSLSRGVSEEYPVYVPYEAGNGDLARKMRKHPTKAEKKIWDELLKGDGMEGLRFLRQKPLEHFIADFYCSSLRLVIEVDGESHAKTIDYDKYRTEEIEKYNIKVIRFSNDEVMDAIEQVKVKLKNEIEKRKIELENSPSLIKEGYGVDCGGYATSLLIGEQPKPADLSYAESFEILIGKASITEVVNDVTYEIHPNSFFQTNSKMAARLQDVVLDAVREAKTKKLLDLYCGLGFFGIAAAKKMGELEQVIGYELDEEAIKLASQNMNANGVGDRCRFFSGPAEALDWKDVEADTIILDPPRSGLHHKVLKTLLAEDSPSYPQTIVYVSCNYHRLEHELPSFMEKYEVTSIQPLDLFPQTRHVETVIKLKLKTSI